MVRERANSLITAKQIAPLRTASINHKETEKLKAKTGEILSGRNPLYLTAPEFEEIVQWKLGLFTDRQRDMRRDNTEEVVREITTLGLTITHAYKDYEIELRMGILTSLRGVSVLLASAVLGICSPKDYAVIDYRCWRQIFAEEKTTYTVPDYKKYMLEIYDLAGELGWDALEVDQAIWEYDRRKTK